MKITNNEIVVELPEETHGSGLIHFGHNAAIDMTKEINKPLVVDVEALAKLLKEHFICQPGWEHLQSWDKFRMAKDFKNTRVYGIAQHLASNLDKWIKEKK